MASLLPLVRLFAGSLAFIFLISLVGCGPSAMEIVIGFFLVFVLFLV